MSEAMADWSESAARSRQFHGVGGEAMETGGSKPLEYLAAQEWDPERGAHAPSVTASTSWGCRRKS